MADHPRLNTHTHERTRLSARAPPPVLWPADHATSTLRRLLLLFLPPIGYSGPPLVVGGGMPGSPGHSRRRPGRRLPRRRSSGPMVVMLLLLTAVSAFFGDWRGTAAISRLCRAYYY